MLCCLGSALLLLSTGLYAQEQTVTAEQIIAEMESLSKDNTPLIRLSAEGFYVQGRNYDPGLLAATAFICVIALAVGLVMQNNQPQGTVWRRWVRTMPFFLLTAMVIFCNVCLALLGSKGVEKADAFLMVAPFFNIVSTILSIGCIAGITHSGRWLGIMWAGFTLLQMWFLFLFFSNVQGDMLVGGVVLTVFTAVFMVMPLVIGLRLHRDDSSKSAESAKQ